MRFGAVGSEAAVGSRCADFELRAQHGGFGEFDCFFGERGWLSDFWIDGHGRGADR